MKRRGAFLKGLIAVFIVLAMSITCAAQTAKRELWDVLARDEYVPLVKEAVERRLAGFRQRAAAAETAATTCTARTRSRGGVSLSRKPLAPASRARTM